MALLFMDGFDTYGTSGASVDLGQAGYAASISVGASNATRTGRGLCVNMTPGFGLQQSCRFRRAHETRDEIVMGIAYKTQFTGLARIVGLLYDNRFGTIKGQIGVYKNAQAGISVGVYDSSGNQSLYAATGPNIIFPNVWQYVEVKYKPGSYIIVRVDGATVLSVGGGANPSCPALINMVDFFAGTDEASLSGGTKWYDDLYICDTTGALFNDFCGDVVIHGLTPNGDAGPNEFAPFGGGLQNYTCVDDIPPDEDLSYLYSNTLGQKDMFTVDALPSNIIDVLAVSVNARVKKDAAGTSNIKLNCKYGDDEVSSEAMTLTTQYVNKFHIFETAPDGGSWNKIKATNMRIGMEIA